MQRLGEMMLARGLVSPRDLAEANAAQMHGGSPLDSTLVRLGAVSETDVLAVMAECYALPLLRSDAFPEAGAILDAVSRLPVTPEWLVKHEALPWFSHDSAGEPEVLHIATRRPQAPALQEACERWTDGPVLFHLASTQALSAAFDAAGLTGPGNSGDAMASELGAARLIELAREAPVIDFVNAVITEALDRRASDIHFEPFEQTFAVRLRIDGALAQWRTGPRASYDAITSRIKLLSGMDIAERRLPQDGRQTVRVSGREIDVRVASLPTAWGESLVLRFLGQTERLPELKELGLEDGRGAAVARMLSPMSGMVLVTGPTGSGKTTTVYRMLMDLSTGEHKIVTVEDPIEIDLPGIMQMRARPDIGLDFARGLRSILRQDPDVILVGEIRDRETAAIAVQAALTGHLVISTLHTSTALGAVARLQDLGVESYLVADVLRGVIGQRLLRRVCASCARPVREEHGEATFARTCDTAPSDAPNWRSGVGCAACANTGYAGRLGAFEVIETDAALRAAIRARLGETELTAIARRSGGESLFQDALVKARRGVTTWREAQRFGETAP